MLVSEHSLEKEEERKKSTAIKQVNDVATVLVRVRVRVMCRTLVQGTAVGAGPFSSTATLTSSFCRVSRKVSTTNKHREEKLNIRFQD